ncbi:MAG: RNA polymerase subunit sigma-70 [Rhodospirillales bacterium]|nr:RNA polymerase subunit sigma-70 [Rhodospirillales bacterium]
MSESPVADNVRRVAHLDLPGAGQVCVSGNWCYIGHIPNKDGLGTSILNIADPAKPRLVTQLYVDDAQSHSHKVRVIGNVMIVNVERNNPGIGRKAEELTTVRGRLRDVLGREPTNGEMAEKLGLDEADVARLIGIGKAKYDGGGFKIFDVSRPTEPRFLHYQKTGGKGVHRFDMDENYAYISTEMDGFQGNILVVYDLADPSNPEEVSRWWIPGQHIAGGETPHWEGRNNRLHHAVRAGDKLWAGMWHGGAYVIDASDMANPKTIGSYNAHPPFPTPTHTVMPVPFKIDGRDIMLTIDEEDAYYNPAEARRRTGQMHAPLSVFDVTDMADIQPMSVFHLRESVSPWSNTPMSRFGAHQFHEKMTDTLVYCAWFSGGLRIIDVADPFAPQEAGSFVPEPVAGNPAPQSNDVFVDDRGLIHLVDRNVGYDILEFTGR